MLTKQYSSLQCVTRQNCRSRKTNYTLPKCLYLSYHSVDKCRTVRCAQ